MNNIYKKLSVILMFLSMVGCFGFGLNCVYAVTGSVTGGYGIPDPVPSKYCPPGVTCGSDGSGGRRPVAYGYRISVVDSSGNHVDKTNSMDYWSEWGFLGYSYLTDNVEYLLSNWGKKDFIYYKIQRPKTEGSSDKYIGNNYSDNTYNTKETLVSKTYKDDVKKEFFEKASFTCNYYGITNYKGFDPDALTDGGCGAGGDTRIGNNFSKYALFVMKKIMGNEDKSEAINVFGSILKDCGVSGDDNNSRIMEVNDKYLMVEPLTAIFDFNGEKIYVGTVYDLYKLGYSAFSVPYVYNNFMYINPVVYNTEKRAGVEGCSSNPNNTVASLTKNGCAGAFTISIGDVAPSCVDQSKKALTTYLKSKKTKDDKDKYNTAINNACNAETKGDKGTCKTVLKNYTNYGIRNDDDIVSCNFTCNSVAQKISNNKLGTTNVISEIYEDLFDTLNKTIYSGILGSSKDDTKYNEDGEVYNIFVYRNNLSTDRTNLCGTISCANLLDGIEKTDKNIDKLSKLFPNYPLLKKDVYKVLEVEPSCDSLPPNCYAKQEGDCSSTGDLVFSDYNKDRTKTPAEHEMCIRKGIAYYDNYQGNLQISKNQSYTSIAGQDVFCSETVTFDLPKESDMITKAGRVFQWGTNIQTTTNNGSDKDVKTFGTMTVKQDCYTGYDSTKYIPKGKNFNWEYNGAKDISTEIKINYEDPTGIYKTNEYSSLTPIFEKATYFGIVMDEDGKIKVPTYYFWIQAEYKFDYNNDFKWYSDKSDEFKSKNANTKTDKNKNSYQFIGYGLPTSLSTSDGTYKSNLDVIIKDIGTNGRFNKYVEKILGQSNGYNYSCSFKIHNETFGNECCTKEGEIIPNAPAYCGKCEGDGEPKGLDVVFRTVDLMDNNSEEELDRAFPGMSGTGVTNGTRKMGANWDKVYSAENGAENVFNILSSSVYNEEYNKEPMYRIKLNVPLIQSIRNANKTMRRNKKDPYTDMEEETPNTLATEGNGYAGYRFSPKDDKKNLYAYSAFLYYLVNSCKASDGGSCLKVSTSNPCIKGNGVHVDGCNQTWWDDKNKNLVE